MAMFKTKTRFPESSHEALAEKAEEMSADAAQKAANSFEAIAKELANPDYASDEKPAAPAPALATPAAPALTPGEYWEWRTTIEEVKTAELEMRIAVQDQNTIVAQAEIARLRAALHQAQNHIETSKQKIAAAKQEYQSTKERIEKRLGVSLAGKVISDSTFEVQDLDAPAP